jgi:hypothetical protein
VNAVRGRQGKLYIFFLNVEGTGTEYKNVCCCSYFLATCKISTIALCCCFTGETLHFIQVVGKGCMASKKQKHAETEDRTLDPQFTKLMHYHCAISASSFWRCDGGFMNSND